MHEEKIASWILEGKDKNTDIDIPSLIKKYKLEESNNFTSEQKDIFLKDLWERFGDVPVDEETGEIIDEDFFIWKKGYNKMDIWNWFDVNYSTGLAVGLMGLSQ